ncbi:hypothetical protein GCM10011495_18680 [Hymenobacter frigidus]|uniref:Uncharacterized protein n=1 Tax=Hymenobacter frigidus TaxID=1524095 RepID=A0ABQ2A2Y2_9BACT|nr:hypothetical protein [Hymenobacter frigidus]GGH85139.1 hypothetical protein GCM10011495_18680 [Hymenobacter frigidus]
MALGYTGNLESRRAGDLQVLKNGPDAATGRLFYVDNSSLRNTADLLYTNNELAGGSLTVKGAVLARRQIRRWLPAGYCAMRWLNEPAAVMSRTM